MTTSTPAPVLDDPPRAPDRAPRRPRRSLSRGTLPVLVVVAVVFFSVIPASASSFPTSANANAIVASNSVLAVCALALLCPLIAGQFDLSVGANAGLSSIVVAALFGSDAPTPVAVLAGVVASVVVGGISGVLVAYFGVSSFIVTLGMTTVIAGGVLAYTAGQNLIDGVPVELTSMSSQGVLGVPPVAFIVLALALALYYLLAFTPFGRTVRAVGSNASAARLVGFDVRRTTLIAFVISGLLCGVAGTLLVIQAGGANPQMGPGYLLPAFAAVFLGATMSRTNGFNVAGTVTAVLFVAVSVSGLVLAGVQPWVEQVFQGAVLILAVTISTVVRRRQESVAA